MLVALVLETSVDVSEIPPLPPDPAILTSRVFVAAVSYTHLRAHET